MAYDGKVVISTKLDNKGFADGLAGLKSSVKSFAATVGVAFGIGAIVAFGKKAIDLASDITEVQNVVDTAFGSMAYKMEAFADTAIETAGMSKLAAKQMGSTFMAMSAGMGQAVEQGSDLAVDMTQRMGDIMSFYNKSLSEAETIGRAVYSGETEPLKQIGVIMNQNALELYAMQNGYKQLYKDMSAADQLFVRQQFFLKATNLAAGDFVKTQDSWANQTRILSERCKELAATLGKSLITVLTPALQLVNSMVAAMLNLAKVFDTVITAVFGGAGKQMEQTKKQAEAVGGAIGGSVANQENLTDETKKTGKAAKNNLSSFDELNVLQKDTGDGGAAAGGGGAIGAPPVETAETEGALTEAAQRMLEVLAPLREISFDNLSKSLEGLKEAIEPLKKSLFVGIEWAYKNVFVPLAKWTAEDVLPQFIDALAAAVGALSIALEVLQPFGTWLIESFLHPLAEWSGEWFIAMIEGIQKDFENLGNWIKENPKIFEAFTVILGTLATAFITVSTAVKVFNGLCHAGDAAIFAIGKAMAFLAANPVVLVIAAIAAVIAIIILLIKNWDDVKIWAVGCWEAIVATWNSASVWFNTTVVQPIARFFTGLWDSIKALALACWQAVKKCWNIVANWFNSSVIQPMTNFFTSLWNAIKDLATWAWTGISDLWQSVSKWFYDNVVAPVADFFTGLWEGVTKTFDAAWEGMTKGFKWYINGWLGMIEGFANFFVNMINHIVDALNSISVDIPDKKIFGDLAGTTFGFNIDRIPQIKLPRLAQGAVIPANREFMAVLGDQKRGMNIEAPADLIRQIVREEGGSREIVIRFEGNMAQLVRLLKPELEKEQSRQGVKLIMEGV
ncbi:MAG: hypothetical protein RSD07_11910 [Angelakisella sp.]